MRKYHLLTYFPFSAFYNNHPKKTIKLKYGGFIIKIQFHFKQIQAKIEWLIRISGKYSFMAVHLLFYCLFTAYL